MMTNDRDTSELWFLNTYVTVALSRTDNSDGLSVLRMQLPFDDAPPLHIHHKEDEVFYILKGEVLFQVGERRLTARVGDTMFGPRGIPHGYRVLSDDGAEFLIITRGGFETMVRRMGRPAERAGLPPCADVSPALQIALADACAEYGIELLGPPIV